MAIFNLKVSPAYNRSAVNKVKYIERIDSFSYEKNNEKYDDFLFSESKNLPSFTNQSAIKFWELAELYERDNSNLFREIEFSLPQELTHTDNIELAQKYAEQLLGNNYVYTLAIHDKKSTKEEINNIHCHIIFCERELDGINRETPEHFFKRANSKNPELGGAKKNRDWHKLEKLYEIRQSWEIICNEKLEENGFEKISSKSLKWQRIDALMNNDFLKAEMLDREPINYSNKVLKFSDEEYKKEVLTFYEYNKNIKEMKEKFFKINSKNYEIENELAKQRFFEKEGLLYNPSNFDVQQKIKEFNYENILTTTIDNQILLDLKIARLDEIENSLLEVRTKAFNIITKNEYSKNLQELETLNKSYNLLNDKKQELAGRTIKRKHLETYFEDLNLDVTLMKNVAEIENNIKNKYAEEKLKLEKDISLLKQNDYVDIFNKYDFRNHELSQILLQETYDNIKQIKLEKKQIDIDVKNHKEYMSRDIKREIYANSKSGKEITKLYDEYINLGSIDTRNESDDRRYQYLNSEFINLDKKWNIKEDIKVIKEKDRDIYKKLRQEQDSLAGTLKYSYLLINKLKESREIKRIDISIKLKNAYDKLKDGFDNDYEKMKFNAKVVKQKLELPTFTIKNDNIIINEFYKKQAQKEIEELENKNREIQKYLAKNILTDEKIEQRILDEYTNNEYSKILTNVNFYTQELKRSINVGDINSNQIHLKNNLEKLNEIKNMFIISKDDIKVGRSIERSKQLDLLTELRTNKEEISNCFDIIKNLNESNKKYKKIQPQPKIYKSKFNKRLKIMKSGAIDLETEEERRWKEMLNEYER